MMCATCVPSRPSRVLRPWSDGTFHRPPGTFTPRVSERLTPPALEPRLHTPRVDPPGDLPRGRRPLPPRPSPTAARGPFGGGAGGGCALHSQPDSPGAGPFSV